VSSFEKGYDSFIRLNDANLAATHGADYVASINDEIDTLMNVLNNPPRAITNVDVNNLKGFVAEWVHAGTFNINAVLNDRDIRAIAPDDNGAVDIFLTDGEKFQLKYFRSAVLSAREQSRAGHDGDSPYYHGQARLIPADQLKETEEWLERRVSEESSRNTVLAQRYQDTLDNLSDRIESNGVESSPFDLEKVKELAQAMQDDGFDPADFGLIIEDFVKKEHIMNQAYQAGISAALISVALKVGPQICGMVCKLIKDGYVKVEDFKRLGFAALTGGSEGFVRGTVAAAVTVTCKSGLFGTALKSVSPRIVGVVVALTMNAIKNSCLLAIGHINEHEYADRCTQDLIISAFSTGIGTFVASVSSIAITPAAAVFGYMIGSFVGSVTGAFIYKNVYSCFMAICVKNGCTFFGIVEQNYELPPEVIKLLGIEVFEYERTESVVFSPQKVRPIEFEPSRNAPIALDIKYIRRGVIRVGIVGYI